MNQNIWNSIELIPLKDNGITGNFEVRILNTGELIHSNKRGMGKTESEDARRAILQKIEDELS